MNRSHIEDIYPLSPMQQGMLFDTLYLEGTGVYIERRALSLKGDLNRDALRQAWDQIAQRHTALRTFFAWENRDKPLQIVHKRVEIPWQAHDWRAVPFEQHTAKLTQFLEDERHRPFNLRQAPLLRLHLIERAADQFYLVIVCHHILLDAWSFNPLLSDLFAHYNHLASGQPLNVAPTRPYSDYVTWVQAQDHAQTETFWRDQLAGFHAPTEIGIEKLSDPQVSTDYRDVRIDLTEAETTRLTAWAQQQRLTLSTVVQGAWAILLSRLSGEQDVVFGTVVSGRPSELDGVESIVGLFINSLPVRVRLTPATTVETCLSQLQETLLTLKQYEHSSLADVQTWSDVPSGNRIFETLVVFENIAGQSPTQTELEVRAANVSVIGQMAYPLTLTVYPHAAMHLQLLCKQTRFADDDIDRLMARLAALLRRLPEQTTTAVNALNIIPTAEQQLLAQFSQSSQADTPPLQSKTWPEMVAAQAQKTPNAVALKTAAAPTAPSFFMTDDDDAADNWTTTNLTYAQLDTTANRFAHQLRAHGIGPEQVVAVCRPRSADSLIMLLAILKAGGVYLPLDPTTPPQRLAQILATSAPALILTDPSTPPIDTSAPTLMIGSLDNLLAQSASPDTVLPITATLDNSAYIIFTSGTTGTPKGVRVSHRALANHAIATASQFDLTEADRVLQFAALSFDVSLEEIGPTWAIGATLVMKPPSLTSFDDFGRLLSDEAISVANLPTPYWHGWVADLAQRPTAALPDRLRLVVAGSEKGSPALLAQWQDRTDNKISWLNGYGPTETAITASFYAPNGTQSDEPAIPIGRPLDNVELFVLDSQLERVPIGIVGELYIGGAGVAEGYVGLPRQTAASFVPHPFSTEAGNRLYRTGDLVRWLPSGDLAFVGRNDEQVKLRGFRIELGEIEAALSDHPQIKSALAVLQATEDTNSDGQIVAYVQTEHALTTKQLRDFVGGALPSYMVPAAFLCLPAWPQLANGKLDRRALPAIKIDNTSEAYIAPSTLIEEQLVAIWQSVLGIDQIGVRDNFFELGGHSLIATQISARIRKQMEISVPVRAFFETPTIQTIAAILAERETQNGTADKLPAMPDLVAGDLSEPQPLSFAQQRMWFLHQLEPESAVYNIPQATLLKGDLNTSALESALNAIVQRHAVLRTDFVEIDNQPMQRIQPNVAITLTVIDLSGQTADTQAVQIKQAVEADLAVPFDLTNCPLLRVKLWRINSDEHVLYLCMHHIISDAWSNNLFAQELMAFYKAAVTGEPPTVDPLPIQYADFARWQRDWLQGERLEDQLAYWREQLAHPPTLELPTDRPRPDIQTYAGQLQSMVLPAETLTALNTLAQQTDTSLFMVVLAAFNVLLSQYSHQTDIVVGTPIANRQDPQVERLIGFFDNTLALRTDLSGNPTWRELIGRVGDVALSAYSHQDIPFEKLVEELKLERDLSRSPIFQVMFTLENTPETALELPALSFESYPFDYPISLFDLFVGFKERADGLHGYITYNTDLFDSRTIDRMAERFKAILQAMTAAPDQAINQMALLSTAEHAQIVGDWNDSWHEQQPDTCIHHLFEQQVARTPNMLAIECDNEQVTYAELNSRANQLAHHLRSLGIGRGSVVALALERSVNALVGLLGILKADGAYLPIDPAYPAERRNFMLTDAGVEIMLTQASLLPQFQDNAITKVCLDSAWPTIARCPTSDPTDTSATTHDLIYVIYTSGSTGRPKGVALPHRALVNLLRWQERQTEQHVGVRTAQFTTLSFDVSCQEIFAVLCTGGALVVMANNVRQDIGLMAQFLHDKAIERLFLPFVALQQLAEVVAMTNAPPPTLREVITCGEQLQSTTAVRALFEQLPQARLWNHYGPTESHVVTSFALSADPQTWSPLPPIGFPIDNTQLYVLDAYLRPVPAGQTGELYIGGVNVAHGYLKRPRRTAANFIPDPFGTVAGARLYRTGDLARYHADGSGAIEFLGRADFQVKLRGYRIELGEVETCLANHPAVQQAVVAADKAHQRLIAYLIFAPEADPNTDTVQAWLEAQLPAYMIPSAWVVVEQFALTPNGKVNRLVLPQPTGSAETIAFVAPQTADEQAIAAIWCDVLGIDKVGINDNFFTLGGHSLLATQIVSRIRQQLAWDVPVRALFETPTIAGIITNHAPDTGDVSLDDLMAELDGTSDLTLADLEALLANDESV